MYYQSISDLPYCESIAIIINVKTAQSTTLALLSLKRYTKYPCLVVDCSDNEDEKYFRALSSDIDFDYVEMPLKIHGCTLDSIFENINAKYVLLLDSDAEILTESFLDMRFLDEENCFGCGFVHGPTKMGSKDMRGGKFCYYAERMYIPCTLLKTERIRYALANGFSFAAKKVYNDFPLPFIARFFYYRFYFRFFQRHDLVFLKPFRKEINGFRPSMIYYDTGAEIYNFLKYVCGYNFIGYPEVYHEVFFAHYHGITRKLLNNKDKNSTDINSVKDLIVTRLQEEYSFDLKKLENL